MKTPTDEQLLVEHLAGKPDAFEHLVRGYSLELYRFVLRFTNNSVAADDVLQEAFLQVYQSAATFDQSRRLKPWIFSIAANKNDGKFSLALTSNNIKAGSYTFHLRGDAKFKYARNVESIKAAEAEQKRLDELIKKFTAETKKDPKDEAAKQKLKDAQVI